MNILFMSLGEFEDLSGSSVHIDVVRELSKSNNVYLACKREKRTQKPTEYSYELGIHVLRIRVGNIKRTTLIQKGLNTISLENLFLSAMKKQFASVKFDLIVYTTPPITFVKPIRYFKTRDKAVTYLMLKDIFPQNAVDLGMISKTGLRSIVYKYFRKKEKELYALSDYVGCMSPANIRYLLKHNPTMKKDAVELFPNCVKINDKSISMDKRYSVRKKYGLPIESVVFVYGGNLGKPQGCSFLLQCLLEQKDNDRAFFLIVGDGTEYSLIKDYLEKHELTNCRLLSGLPKEEYELLAAACDVGLVFLDYRFTIPNFPSRILSYMQARLPILCATDSNTDIGEIIVNNGFGWWSESNDTQTFSDAVQAALQSERQLMGDKAFEYLCEHYDVSKCCGQLIKDIESRIDH